MMKPTAATLFYFRNFCDAFISGLIFTSLYAYYVRVIGMTPFQLLLLGSVLMTTGFLFEVPTGIVADLYSRKLSVIIGGLLIGICYLWIGAVPLVAVAFGAAMIEAIGDTFVSGALDAWISDEVGAENAGRLFLRAAQLGAPAHWLGIGASVLLATRFDYQVPIRIGGGLWIVTSLFLWFAMPETAFVRPVQRLRTHRFSLRPQFENALETFRGGAALIRTTPILLLLIGAELFVGAFFEGFFRLYRVQFLTNLSFPVLSLPWIGQLDDVVWFGVMDALGSLVGIVAIEITLRKLRLAQSALPARLLMGIYAAIILSVLLFAYTGIFGLAMVAFLVIKFLVELADPITKNWLNQQLSPQVRATVLSMRSQVNLLGQLGGGLSVGVISTLFGLRAALAMAGMLLAPLLLVYAKGRYAIEKRE